MNKTKANGFLIKFFWLLLLGLLLQVFIVNSFADGFFAEASNAKTKTTSNSRWNSFQYAKENEWIDLKATLFADFRGRISKPWTRVESFAEIFGCNANDCRFLNKTDSIFQEVSASGFGEAQWNSALRTTTEFERIEFVVKARTEDNDFVDNTTSTAIVQLRPFSNCSQLDLFVHNIEMNENTKTLDYADVLNNSSEVFEITDALVYSNESFFDAAKQGNSRIIESNRTGKIEFELNAKNVDETENGRVFVEFRGFFKNSKKECFFSDTRESFGATVRNVVPTAKELCSKISVSTKNFYLNEQEEKINSFLISNDANMSFVPEASFFSNHSALSLFVESISSKIPANGIGSLRVKAKTGSVSFNQSANASLFLSGDFSDGTRCNSDDIGEKFFSISIRDILAFSDCNKLIAESKNIELNENSSLSTSFALKNETGKNFAVEKIEIENPSSNYLIELTGIPSNLPAKNSHNLEFKIASNFVSQSIQSNNSIKLKGKFEDGLECNVVPNAFAVTVNNTTEKSAFCSSISLEKRSIAMQSNSSQTIELFIKNNSGKRFIIDGINQTNAEKKLIAKILEKKDFVEPNSFGIIKIELTALPTEKDIEDNVIVEIRGRFFDSTQNLCSVPDIQKGEISVKIIGEEKTANCGEFSMNIPIEKTIIQKGSAEVIVNNPTNKQAIVEAKAQKALLSPSLFLIEPKTITARAIEIKTIENGLDLLVFSVQLGDCGIPEKYTKLILEKTQGIELLNYSEKIDLNKTEKFIEFELLNKTGKIATAKARITQLPSNWQSEEKEFELMPNSGRTIKLNLTAGDANFYGNALLEIESNGTKIEREIPIAAEKIESKEIGKQEKEIQPKPASVGLPTTILAALGDFSQNGLAIGAILFIIIITTILVLKERRQT